MYFKKDVLILGYSTLNRVSVIAFYSILVLGMFFAINPFVNIVDGDQFFHIEIGRYMLENKHIVKDAIHTFAGNSIPYVSHEIGFQLIIGAIYNWMGWKGLHLFIVICAAFYMAGIYRLMQLSRIEIGKKDFPPLLHFFVPFLLMMVFYYYFRIRPQTLSIVLVLWFVNFMLEMRIKPSWKSIGLLAGSSLAIANIHTGVWPVIIVFYSMVVIEAIFTKRFFSKKMATYYLGGGLLVLLPAFLNFGGLNSVMYFFTLTKDGMVPINEWFPYKFSMKYDIVLLLVIFFFTAGRVLRKSWFHFFLAIGIFYLGLSSIKQYLFFMTFMPFFLAVGLDRTKWWMQVNEGLDVITHRKVWFIFLIVAAMNIVICFSKDFTMGSYKAFPIPKVQENMPVKEMEFIKKDFKEKDIRPKILTSYSGSKYVMFSGGDILADGRYDPFIHQKSVGVFNLTAFQRSRKIFGGMFPLVYDEIRYSRPDYLIYPFSYGETKEVRDWEIKSLEKELGKPKFVGDFGYVWDVRDFK